MGPFRACASSLAGCLSGDHIESRVVSSEVDPNIDDIDMLLPERCADVAEFSRAYGEGTGGAYALDVSGAY